MLAPQTTLNCNGTLLDLLYPIVMGILNVTPDSFFDGGRYQNEKNILLQVERMISEGAEIIDIGGMSSRPGAIVVSIEEEIQRVLPALTSIKKHFPEVVVSVDTWRSEVARVSVAEGAGMINDISGGQYDAMLFETVASFKNIPFILMHIKGTPDSMQKAPHYDNLLEEILKYFIEKLDRLRELGVKDIVLDPGFGFGKTIEHNYTILKNLHAYKIMDLPILAGLSRKSMIYKPLNISASEALNATCALNMVALQQGAKILRVHDVKAATEVIQLYKMLEFKF
jgi:dihydropteroate synthase